MRRSQFVLLAVAALSPSLAWSQAAIPPGEWPAYHRDVAGTRYSPLDQINRDNVSKLAIAWTWKPDSTDRPTEAKNENTPLMVNGVLYFTSGSRRNVVAADAATGVQKWIWRMDEGPRFAASPRAGAGRGVAYWTNGREARIFVVTPGFQLVALDAATGKQIPTFGTNGIVDLKLQLGVPDIDIVTAQIGSSSPPMVFENVVVIGPALEVGLAPTSYKNIPGRIIAIDAVTGAFKWRFNTIPLKGEVGYETWENGSAEYTGNTGAWAPFAVDTRRGWIFMPVEDATGDYYGGHRHGDNLFSSSLVAADIRTGKRIWHFQLIHHDVWDRDPPTSPILADITVNGQRVEAVVQITKQSWAYVFDRVTGKPVWPMPETPVPQSDIPGEKTAKTQPIPSKPAPFDRQTVRVEDLIDFTPELRAAALEVIKPYRLGEVFTPPSLAMAPDGTRGTLSLPGTVGGANWEHGAYDPETQTLFVGSFTNVGLLAMAKSPRSDMDYVASVRVPTVSLPSAAGAGGARGGGRGGLPLMKPPYSRITAINLNTGDHLWMVPNGDTPESVKNNPALAGLTIPPTGATTRPTILATKTLLFTLEGYGSRPIMHVLDKTTGQRIADLPIPGTPSSQPMTYMVNNKQYVAFWAAPPQQGGQLVVMALP